MSGSRSALLLAVLIAVVLATSTVPGAPRAEAHAVLERSSPAQNEQLEQAPALVETWFSEPLERSLTAIEVLDTQGNSVQTGDTQFGDDPLYAAAALPPELPPGIYTVTYENVSTVDGHAWRGFFTFIILNADGSVPEGTAFEPGGPAGGSGQGYLPGAGDSYFRWIGLIAAVALSGGVAFYLLIARPAAGFLQRDRAESISAAAFSTASNVVVLSVPVLIASVVGQLFLLGDRLDGIGQIDNVLFETRTGQLWLTRIGLAAALLALYLPAAWRPSFRTGAYASVISAVALIGSLGLLMTYSLGSHAGVGGGEFWSVSADFVHLAATAAWLGTLLQLPFVFWWTRSRLEGDERLVYQATVFDRFSWLAVIGVALVIGTGVFNSFVQLPSRPSLWETTYGRVLIAKLALIMPLLGIAALNALLLKPALVDAVKGLTGDADTGPTIASRLAGRIERLQRALPRTIVAEFLLGAAVLGSVSVLTQSTTAEGELRAAASEGGTEFVATSEAGDLDVELRIDPLRLGVSTFIARLEPQQGAELGDVIDVRLTAIFDDPTVPASAGTTGTRQELEPADAPGVYTADAALLSQPGDWRLQVGVRRRGVDDAVTDFISVPNVGGGRDERPEGMFDLPFTFVDWNVVAGGALLTLGLGVVLIWRNRPRAWRRAVSATVGITGAAMLAAGTVFIWGVDAHQTEVLRDSPVPPTNQSLATGQSLFELNCRVCHGPQGRGDGPQARTLRVPPADLRTHVPLHNDGTIFLWITEGIPIDQDTKVMPSFQSQLSEDERWHLVNFLRETFGTGDGEPALSERSAGP